MKKKVLKKWATRILLATDFYFVVDSDKNEIDKVINRSTNVSSKFVARALTYPSFKNFIKKDCDAEFKPNFKYYNDNHVIYLDAHFYQSSKDCYFEAFMYPDGHIDMFSFPSNVKTRR